MSFSDDVKKEQDLARRRFVHGTRNRGPMTLEEAQALHRRMEGKEKAISDFTRVCDQTGLSEKLRKD